MIRIQTYNSTPRRIQAGGINPGNQPTLRTVSGRAEDRTLAAMLQSGLKLTDIAVKEYVSNETARVSQSLQQMNAELAAERERYMRENQGQNALNAGEHFENFARELAEKHLADGKFQGRFAQEFVQQAAGTALHFTEQGRSYAGQQRAAWQDSLLKGEISTFQNQVAQNYDNKDWIEFNLANLTHRINEMRPGLDNRALLDDVRKDAAEGVIDGFLASGRVGDARGALAQYRDMLGDRANAVKVRIDAHADALQAKAEANRNKQARTLLSGLKDAEYAAQNMGDYSRMRAIAEGLQKLGMKDEAEEVLTQADFWQANRHAADYAQRQPLPDVRRKAEELQSQLKSETDTDIHRRLSEELKATAKIFSERVKAYQDDPAQAAASSVTLPDDATPEDVARLRVENERANGVPPDALMPLTQIEAGQLATQWAALPAEQRPAFIHELQAYGAYAPQVMKQVGISVMEQDMAFSMLNDPQNVGGAKAVFSAMSLDEKDLPKIEEKDALAEFLEDSDVYQVYLTQAQSTNSPDLWKTVKDYEQAATRLLKTGKSVEDVKRILNAGRERLTGDNMAVLVPAYHAEEVKNGLQRAMGKRLEAFVRTGMSDSPDYEVKEELRRIRNTGIFVNSPDGKGFTLLDGVTGLPYRDNTGNTFSFSMDTAEIFAEGSEDALLRWVVNGMAGVSE